LEQLEQFRGLGRQMCGYYGIDEANSPELLDRLYEVWRDDVREKVEPLHAACAIGAMLGDILSDRLCFDWCMIVDEQGVEFCLKSEVSDWETYPVNYVWKRVEPGADEHINFCAGAWDLFRERVRPRKLQ